MDYVIGRPDVYRVMSGCDMTRYQTLGGAGEHQYGDYFTISRKKVGLAGRCGPLSNRNH